MSIRRHCLTVVVVFVLAGSACADGNWNQFRGPDGNGFTDAKGLPVEMGAQTNVVWKFALAGKAWSSPVVSGSVVWLTNAPEDGAWLDVLAFNVKTGERIRGVRIFENADPQFCHPMNSYATPTPIVSDGRVYVHFGAHGTAALDEKTGQVLWTRRDLECNHHRGPASSPTLWNDRLYLIFDGFDVQYVACLNAKDGKTLWKQDRTYDFATNNGDRKKAYATPAVVDIGGVPQLICPGANATEAYNPTSGEPLWHVTHGGMNASCRPIYHDGLLYVTNGMGTLLAIDPAGATGDATKSALVWESAKAMPKKSSPVLIGQHLYCINDSGVASCLNAKTGENVWTERIGGDFAASPLTDGERIWFFDRDGKVVVIAASPEFQLLHENNFPEGFMASPAVVGSDLILRTTGHLFRIGSGGQTR